MQEIRSINIRFVDCTLMSGLVFTVFPLSDYGHPTLVILFSFNKKKSKLIL